MYGNRSSYLFLPTKYCDTHVCVCVCLTARISPEPHARSLPIFVHVAYDRGSVLRHRCDTLCTSGFVDDIMFFLYSSTILFHLFLRDVISQSL